MSAFSLRQVGAALAMCLPVAGCATTGDPMASRSATSATERNGSSVVVKTGKPNLFADGLAGVVQFPRPLFRRMSTHPERYDSEAAVGKAVAYLEANDLADIQILAHRHDPADQWRRLRSNDRVPAWKRYSLGSLSLLSYNLLPPRIWGFDEYNAFTNTLHMNSDLVYMAAYRGATTKQIHDSRVPLMTAIAGDLPPTSFIVHRRATSDLIAYHRAQDDWDAERNVYEKVYPTVGANSATLAILAYPVWWMIPATRVGGAMAGQIAGASALKRRLAEREAAGEGVSDSEEDVQLASHHKAVEPAAVVGDIDDGPVIIHDDHRPRALPPSRAARLPPTSARPQ